MRFSHHATKKLVDESTSTEVAIRRTTKKVDKEALIAQRLLETKKKTRSKFGTTPLGPHDYVPFPGDDDIPATRVKEEKVKTKESDMTYKYYVRDLGIGNATELVTWIDQLAELLLFIVEDRAKLPEMTWLSASRIILRTLQGEARARAVKIMADPKFKAQTYAYSSMKAKSYENSPEANLQEEGRKLELSCANIRQACLEGWNNQEYDPSEAEFLDFPAYGDVRVFLSNFSLLYVVENAVEQQDRAMRRSKKEAYMSPSEYLEYIEKVDRDIRKLPSYRGRPQPTDRSTLFTYMLDGLHPDTQANLQFDLTEEELQGRGDLDSALRKVDLRDGKDLRAAVEARARNKVEKTKSKMPDRSKENNKGKGNKKRKKQDNEDVTCSKCGKNGHSVDECWFEHPELAPKHLRKYFTKKKQAGPSSSKQEVHLMETEAEIPSDPLDWLSELEEGELIFEEEEEDSKPAAKVSLDYNIQTCLIFKDTNSLKVKSTVSPNMLKCEVIVSVKCYTVEANKFYFKNIIALLDTGCSKTLLIKSSLPHNFYKNTKNLLEKPNSWNTGNGHFLTGQVLRADFRLPEFNVNRDICYEVALDDRHSSFIRTYDMIIGRDLLADLGVIIDFKNYIIDWAGTRKNMLLNIESSYSTPKKIEFRQNNITHMLKNSDN